MPIISLLTDFGLDDEYAGVMKGVILSINPAAVIVDLTHRIKPQGILQAALLIESAFRFFPEHTIHIIVVDPGVGSERAILACESENHIFIAPDNGVLTRLLDKGSGAKMVRVENPDYFLKPVSRTFHGRDIFAPVAAHLAAGAVLDSLGPRLDPGVVVRLPIPKAFATESGTIIGSVIAIDYFGNLTTNIDLNMLAECGIPAKKALTVLGSAALKGIGQSYSGAAPGEALVLSGSRGLLEIAVNRGSAEAMFKASVGSAVRVRKG